MELAPHRPTTKAIQKQRAMEAIPEGWEATKLGNVADVVMGQSPVGTSYNRHEDGTPLINGPTEFTDKYPIRIQWTTKPTMFSKVGDVLLCVRGSSTGRINISDDEYCIGRGIAAIRAQAHADTTFVSYVVARAVQRILVLTTGSTFPNVNGQSLRSIDFMCPPLREQRAIAEALTDADTLVASLDMLIAKKREMRTGIMQQLLTGKRRLPGFSGKWEMKRLGEVGACLRGVSYRGEADLAPYDTGATKRLLRANNVQNATIGTEDIQFVNAARVSSKQVMREGDVLVCMASGSRDLAGKAAAFHLRDGYEYTFGAFMWCFRSNSRLVDVAFVSFLFQTGQYRDYIANLLAGSSINNLRPSAIESLEFSLPAIEEQNAIAAVLASVDGELAALEARRGKTHALKQGMMQQLLTGKIRLI